MLQVRRKIRLVAFGSVQETQKIPQALADKLEVCERDVTGTFSDEVIEVNNFKAVQLAAGWAQVR
jgi:hypothetical protein